MLYFLLLGQLSAKNLDYEAHHSYDLVIDASDGVHAVRASVNVIVSNTNDPPHFDHSVFTANVDEDAKENTVVKSLGITSDGSGSHICAWGAKGVTPEVISLFTLTTESRSCIVKVAKTGTLKWRKDRPGYNFAVRAINKNNRNQVSTAMLEGNHFCCYYSMHVVVVLA